MITIFSPNPVSAQTEVINLTVSNVFNCQATDDIALQFLPIIQAAIIADESGICLGNSIQLEATGGLSYSWNDPNNSLSETDLRNPIATPEETTVYTVTVTDNCPDNIDVIQFELEVFPQKEITIIKDTCMIRGRSIELFADGGEFYNWEPAEFIVGSNQIEEPTIDIMEETTFQVTITDENGCEYQENVRVCFIDDPLSIFQAVSIITPNGDGDNDFLEFLGLEAYPDNELIIFNRWGNVVYDRTRYQEGGDLWDGTKNGKPLPSGVYYYILRFSDFEIKSSLTLIYE